VPAYLGVNVGTITGEIYGRRPCQLLLPLFTYEDLVIGRLPTQGYTRLDLAENATRLIEKVPHCEEDGVGIGRVVFVVLGARRFPPVIAKPGSSLSSAS
jgi:hypothetical protein